MSVREEILALNRELTRRAAAGDAPSVAALYDEEAHFVVAGAPTYSGRAALAELCEEFLSHGPVGIAYEPEVVWGDDDLVATLGQLRIGAGSERCVVVYRRDPQGHLKILLDAPVREPAS